MPKSKLADAAKRSKIQKDPIKELICGRMKVLDISTEDLMDVIGVSMSTAYKRIKEPTDTWRWKEIRNTCKFLEITSEDLARVIKI